MKITITINTRKKSEQISALLKMIAKIFTILDKKKSKMTGREGAGIIDKDTGKSIAHLTIER